VLADAVMEGGSVAAPIRPPSLRCPTASS